MSNAVRLLVLLCCGVGFSWIVGGQGNDPTLRDKSFAKYACILGCNRLNQDLLDQKGLLLLRVAGVIDPQNPDFLYNFNLIKRGLKPDAVQIPVTETIFFQRLEEHIHFLQTHYLPKCPAIRELLALYSYLLLEFDPRNRVAATCLEQLTLGGYHYDLEYLLSNPIQLTRVYDPNAKPSLSFSSSQAAASLGGGSSAAPTNGVPIPEKGALPEPTSLNVRINVNDGEELLREHFFVDPSVTRQTILDVGRIPSPQRAFNAWLIFSPKSKLGLTSKFGFTGDCTIAFRGVFEKIQISLGPYYIEYPKKVLETARIFRISVEGEKLRWEAGQNVLTLVKEQGITPPSVQKPYGFSLAAYQSNEPIGKLYSIHLQGRVLPLPSQDTK